MQQEIGLGLCLEPIFPGGIRLSPRAGIGAPAERAEAAIAADIEEGLVSRDIAATVYGTDNAVK